MYGKQCRPWSDATFWGFWSESTVCKSLFVPILRVIMVYMCMFTQTFQHTYLCSLIMVCVISGCCCMKKWILTDLCWNADQFVFTLFTFKPRHAYLSSIRYSVWTVFIHFCYYSLTIDEQHLIKVATCKQWMSRLACAPLQPDLDILCSSTYTTVSIHSVSRQWRPRSACTFAHQLLFLKLLITPFLLLFTTFFYSMQKVIYLICFVLNYFFFLRYYILPFHGLQNYG